MTDFIEEKDFDDWDESDFESSLREDIEAEDRPGYRRVDTRTRVSWSELCDTLDALYVQGGLAAVEKHLLTHRPSRTLDLPEHTFVDKMYDEAKKGDRRAWGVLYQLYEYKATCNVKRYVPRHDEGVEDIVHDAFVSLINNPPASGTFAGLIMRATEYRAIDYLRRQNTRKVELVPVEALTTDDGETAVLDELEDPDTAHPYLTAVTTETPEGLTSAAQVDALLAAWGRECGDHKYAAFLLVEMDGVEPSVVAKEFKTTPRTVYRWCEEVRDHVRTRLQESDFL